MYNFFPFFFTAPHVFLKNLIMIFMSRNKRFLSIPVADIVNSGIASGKWPKIYKNETITPVPKQFPPETMDLLRPISNLLNLDKIMEKIICDMVIADMKNDLDKKQFGNQPHLGIQHYLIRLVHRILTNLDKNSKGEI